MEEKLKIKKSRLILGLSIALFSLKMYFGGIFGYLFAKFFSDRMNPLIFNVGSYKLHLHHWITGSTALTLAVVYDITPLMNQLFFGFMGGLIVQGIVSYSDWHRVLTRRKL